MFNGHRKSGRKTNTTKFKEKQKKHRYTSSSAQSSKEASLARNLDSTDPVIEFQNLQTEVRTLLRDINKPFYDIVIGLIIMPNVFKVLKNSIGIDIAEQYVKAKFEAGYQELLKIRAIEAQQTISQYLQNNLAIEQWGNEVSKTLIQVFRQFQSLSKQCIPVYKTINKDEIKKNLLLDKYPAILKCCDAVLHLKQYFEAALKKVSEDPSSLSLFSKNCADELELFHNQILICQVSKSEHDLLFDSGPAKVIDQINYFVGSVLSRFTTHLSLGSIFRLRPYGLLTYKYRDEKYQHLLDPHYLPRDAKLEQNLQLLNEITHELKPMRDKVNQFMQVLFYTFLIIFIISFFQFKLGGEISPFLIFYLFDAFSAQYLYNSIIDFIKTQWENRKVNNVIESNRTVLNQVSNELVFSRWRLTSTNKNDSFFILRFSKHDTVTIDDDQIPVKFFREALIAILTKYHVEIAFFNEQIIKIPATNPLPSAVKNYLLTEIKKDISTSWQKNNDEKKLQQQIKRISRQLYGSDSLYIKARTEEKNESAFYFTFELRHKNKADDFYTNLKTAFGNNRVSIKENENKIVVYILNGPPCEEKTFSKIIREIPYLWDGTPNFKDKEQSAESSTVRIKAIAPINTTLQTESTDNNPVQKPRIINFGKWGKYDSSKKTNKIEPITAPFWSKHNPTHFRVFNAPRSSFNNDEEYDNFKNMRPHIVNGKGHKGIVHGGRYLMFPDGKSRMSSYKEKDPNYDISIHCRDEIFKDSEGKKVTLHIFEAIGEHKKIHL